jgi:hypothetical protein
MYMPAEEVHGERKERATATRTSSARTLQQPNLHIRVCRVQVFLNKAANRLEGALERGERDEHSGRVLTRGKHRWRNWGRRTHGNDASIEVVQDVDEREEGDRLPRGRALQSAKLCVHRGEEAHFVVTAFSLLFQLI